MLAWLKRSAGKSRAPKERGEFECLMARARVLKERENVAGLRDLIKIVLRPVQSLHMRDAYLKEPHKAVGSLFWSESLGLERVIPGINKRLIDFVWSNECLVEDKSLYPSLNLASSVTLPTSWSPASIVANLGRIGEGLPGGPFQQSSNHSVMLSYPLDIGWVANGNHSLIQAILRGQGHVIPTEVHDLSLLIELVKFDGREWRSILTEDVLGVPAYPEFGWVWEIGRLISSIEVSPYKEAISHQTSGDKSELTIL